MPQGRGSARVPAPGPRRWPAGSDCRPPGAVTARRLTPAEGPRRSPGVHPRPSLPGGCSCLSAPGRPRLRVQPSRVVCLGMLIKPVLSWVGGASPSAAGSFTHPLYSFLFHRCAAAGARARGPRRGGESAQVREKPPREKENTSANPRTVSVVIPREGRGKKNKTFILFSFARSYTFYMSLSLHL